MGKRVAMPTGKIRVVSGPKKRVKGRRGAVGARQGGGSQRRGKAGARDGKDGAKGSENLGGERPIRVNRLCWGRAGGRTTPKKEIGDITGKGARGKQAVRVRAGRSVQCMACM